MGTRANVSGKAAGLDGRSVLQAHGKSFYFAGRFLGRETLEACARLYAFCRYVDDEVDMATTVEVARASLEQIRDELRRGVSQRPAVADFIALSGEHALSGEVTEALLDGMESDLGPVRIEDEAQLLRYAYRVAGTVGVHMAQVLGTRKLEAIYHAVDLGIAMQLTNIARDVVEDAERDRIYLPRTITGPLAPWQLCDPAYRSQVAGAVRALLDMAERYYASGMAGIPFLPRRAQFGILVAGRVYREIGEVLRRRGDSVWEGRAYVGKWRKVYLAGCAYGHYRRLCRVQPGAAERHLTELHGALKDLPFCHHHAIAKA
jgi:phytoene synthase